AGRVLVPAAPGLAPEAPGGHQSRRQRRRAPAWLAERLLVERAGDGQPDVDADQVHQRERAHAEPAAPAAAVDRLGRRDPLLHDPQRLERERAVAAVDDEADAVGSLDHVAAHRLAVPQPYYTGVQRVVAAPHALQQPHLLRRFQEVYADNAPEL